MSMVGRSLSASSSPVSMPDDCTEAPEVSSGTLSGIPFDMHRFRTVFPGRWADFLRAHFRDARHVAFAFDVDDKTARNWIAGITAPRAEVALYAVSRFPDALPRLMGAA